MNVSIRKLKVAILLCLGLTLLLASCSTSDQIPTSEKLELLPSYPIPVTLALSKAPALYEPVNLTITVSTTVFDEMPDLEVWVELPEGAHSLDGDLFWQVDLVRDVPVTFNATLVFVCEGIWYLHAYSRFYFTGGYDGGFARLGIYFRNGESLLEWPYETPERGGYPDILDPGDGTLVPRPTLTPTQSCIYDSSRLLATPQP